MGFEPGQTLGNYQVVERIGVGGMGEVYLAEHPLIGKRVALKVIHPELTSNREIVQRFFTEARAANKIGSEHIVEIHDFGQTPEGNHFFIMEYLEGTTVAHEIGMNGVLPTPRVLHVGAQVAKALGAAHDAGIIHRDLKPDNVMLISKLGDPDFVKVLDFGLAKIFADGDAQKLTALGVVLGTPHFMSPEACESRKGIDHRTDIYSLGVLLFQMLCGRLPFHGGSMGEVLIKQVAHPPPALRGINPDIPPAVEQIVLRCLAKAPSARFQSMAELRDALLDPERYLAGSPPVMPTAGPEHDTLVDAVRRHGTAAFDATAPAPALPGEAAEPVRGLPHPAAVTNQTMAIMTPAGHLGRRPTRRRGLVAVLGVSAAIGAVVITALVSVERAAGPAAAPATAGAMGSTAAVAPTADAAVRLVRITITSTPPGASVVEGDELVIGTTPMTREFPIDGRTVTLALRHREAMPGSAVFVPTRDETIAVALTPLSRHDQPPEASAATPPPAAPPAATVSPAPAASPAPASRPRVEAKRTAPSAPPRSPAPARSAKKPRKGRVGEATLPPDF